MTPVVHVGGIVSADGISGPASIHLDGGAIQTIEPPTSSLATGDIDARDLVIGPGMIDIHTHGISGSQSIDGRRDSLVSMAQAYARGGVTGFLATIGGAALTTDAAIRAVVDFIEGPDAQSGSRCLGIHLEGPFINPARPGAFVPSTILAPDLIRLEQLMTLARGHLRRITLAPELPGIEPLIDAAVAHGVTCSAGHSEATFDEATRAVDRGVTSVTHLFNAMPSLHHRAPGLVGVALTDERVIVEMIPDGVHVIPIVMRLVARAKGWQGIALVTDSIGAAGLPDGTYAFEEQTICVQGGEARLADGTLAGSTATLNEGVRTFAATVGIPWHEAQASASLTPARLLNLDHTRGRIAAGMTADLVAFDAVRAVRWTMVAGRMIQNSPG